LGRVDQSFAAFRGRPPFDPFLRAAAALAGDLACPALRASAFAIQSRVPKDASDQGRNVEIHVQRRPM